MRQAPVLFAVLVTGLSACSEDAAAPDPGSNGGAGGTGGAAGSGGAPGCDMSCGPHKWACWPMPNPAGSGLPNAASYQDLGEVVHDDLTCLAVRRAQQRLVLGLPRCSRQRGGGLGAQLRRRVHGLQRGGQRGVELLHRGLGALRSLRSAEDMGMVAAVPGQLREKPSSRLVDRIEGSERIGRPREPADGRDHAALESGADHDRYAAQ